jgi:triosephosphate isomerase
MKIIALNWKNTQTQESAQTLLKTVEDVANIYPDYEWIVFPGDPLLCPLEKGEEWVNLTLSNEGWKFKWRGEGGFQGYWNHIKLGNQQFSEENALPYCLIGHMSQRLAGKTDGVIKWEIERVKEGPITPFLCVGPLREEDTLSTVLTEQLTVLENWPRERPIVIAYEPGFAVGTGKTMTLEDIEIVTDILSKAFEIFENKRIIYGGSVNDTNIAQILTITDGVLIGTASQKSSTLLALSIALGQD